MREGVRSGSQGSNSSRAASGPGVDRSHVGGGSTLAVAVPLIVGLAGVGLEVHGFFDEWLRYRPDGLGHVAHGVV